MTKFLSYLFGRLREPSTYAGLAAVTVGVSELAKIKEGAAIADAVGAAGQAVAAGADPVTAAIITAGGLVAAFAKDRGASK